MYRELAPLILFKCSISIAVMAIPSTLTAILYNFLVPVLWCSHGDAADDYVPSILPQVYLYEHVSMLINIKSVCKCKVHTCEHPVMLEQIWSELLSLSLLCLSSDHCLGGFH